MLKLSNISRYAVQAVVYLSSQGQDQFIPSYQIARATGLPEKFLLKVIGRLADARLMRTVKGPNGGCRLGRKPQEINLLEIIEAVDGPVRGEIPIPFDGEQGATEKRLGVVFDQVSEIVRREWGKIKVPDIINKRNPSDKNKGLGV